MLNVYLALAVTAISAAVCWGMSRRLNRRVQVLEQSLRRISEDMAQMADLQMKTHERLSARFDEVEERIMELSLPSRDADLPLERRHQVLALDRQGVPLKDIVKRLKAPIGEAELILNLRKYRGRENAGARPAGQVGQYA